jgi:hypothetical protein
MAMVKVLLGCSTVQKYKRKNINLGNGRCVSVSQSGDKSEMINLFELRKVAGRLVAWAEQLDFIRCYFKPRVAKFHSVSLSNQIQPKDSPLLL